MQVFAEQELSNWLRLWHNRLTQEVVTTDRNYLLNVNETQFIDYLVGEWSMASVSLHFDALSVSDCERDIPAIHHPSDFQFTDRSRSFRRHVVLYHIPVSGNTELLRCFPSKRLMWDLEASLNNGCLHFDIIDWRNNPEEIKRNAEGLLSNLKTQAENVQTEVYAFNQSLPDVVKSAVEKRKKEMMTQLSTLAALGVPVRQQANVPSTFAVPIKPNKTVVKPSAPTQAFAPEPTLDAQNYDSILSLIHIWGVEMERHPGIYSDKGEESLRDLFLMLLSPHFDSTTGETFNKSGKTDILIRHEGKNVFVAECKFWRGIKAFHPTIDQLLGYLTWRDSKAAVICFVDNKELNPLLEQIVAETPKHSCFVKDCGKKADGWFQFEFHLKDDPSRGVKLAVLCFHFPKTG